MATTRDALVAGATALLDQGGVDAVTLREVGRRAGISHNAPYRHFADKEALLAAVAARELDEYAALLRGSSGGNAPPSLEAAIRAYVGRALDYPARFRLVYGPWSTESADLERSAAAAGTLLVDTVVAEQRRGSLPGGPPGRVADLIRSTAHGAIDLALAGHLSKHDELPTTPQELVADFLAILRRSRESDDLFS